MTNAEKLLSVAIGELGTKERPANSNNVKYNTWYYKQEVYDGKNGGKYPWCMAFVQWCFNEAGFPLPFKTASCSGLLSWYKNNRPKCVVESPTPGCIVIYNGHTGILEQINGNTITVIEGNTSLTNNNNGGEVMRRTRNINIVVAFIKPESLEDTIAKARKTNYYIKNGVHIVEAPVAGVKIKMTDKPKRASAKKNFVNAGFFGYNKTTKHTGPVSMLRCDRDDDSNIGAAVLRECTVLQKKLTHQTQSYDAQFFGKFQTALILKDGRASIAEIKSVPTDCDYAIAGVPIMRNGADVPFYGFVTSQGWDASTVYATWHIFVGLKDNDASTLYIMGMKTKTTNMIRSSEAYKVFKAMGFKNVMKLDGGGSYIMNYGGKIVSNYGVNRQINNIITFEDVEGEESTPPTNAGYIEYIVKRGDTLSKIAKSYGTTYQVLASYNGIANPNVLKVGQIIKIPR